MNYAQTRVPPATVSALRHRLSRAQVRHLSWYRTTTVERFLLFVTILLVPLENNIPSVAGFSITWFVFGVIGLFVFLMRPAAFEQVCRHPVFLSAYVFVAIGIFVESIHLNPDFRESFRIGQMVIGAVLIASLCRDRRALSIAMMGLLVAGVYVSAFSLTSYGVLSQAQVGNFDQATQARAEASAENLVEVNLNGAAATSARGAVVAMVFALFVIRRFRRYFCWAAAVICLVGVFLTVSRSGIANVFLSSAAVLFAAGFKNKKWLLAAGFFAAISILVVPEVVWYRMTFSTETHEGHMEARARVYTAAIEHLPEYVLMGVGVRNFWGSWGEQSEFFAQGHYSIIGSHNGLIQVTIYWGFAGLFGLLWLIWRAYKCLPEQDGKDPLALCLIGMSLSLLLLLMTVHNVYAKEFAVGLGLLAGSHRWIWQRRPFLIRRS